MSKLFYTRVAKKSRSTSQFYDGEFEHRVDILEQFIRPVTVTYCGWEGVTASPQVTIFKFSRSRAVFQFPQSHLLE